LPTRTESSPRSAQTLSPSLPRLARIPRSWTCDSCSVRTRFANGGGPERGELPIGWAYTDRGLLCLACRREAVAAAAVATADPRADTDAVERQALARFELERDPDRTDGRIAAALGVGVAAVRTQRRVLRDAGQLAA
jgi:hypothetical protein